MSIRRVIVPVCFVLIIAAAFLIRIARGSHAFSMHILDVGQGDAILLRKGRVDILIDGGPSSVVLERLGEVRPVWDRHLDVVILSHADADHLTGLLDVVERADVRLVILPAVPVETQAFRRFVDTLNEKGIAVRAAEVGQRLQIDSLHLEVLAPNAEQLTRGSKQRNNASVVLRGDVPEFSFLLTGDIEASSERTLLSRAGSRLDVDVLKVAHHGSKTSSSQGFLAAVSPALSFVSVGKENRYGHPHSDVLARYPPDSLLRTDLHGTISLYKDAMGVSVRCSRECPIHHRLD